MNEFTRAALLGMALLAFAPAETTAADTPTLAMKIAEYPRALSCRLPGGGAWRLGSRSGGIGGTDRVSVTGTLVTPAVKRFHVMVESAPRREPARVEAALATWRASGRPIHTFEAGHISYQEDGKTVSWDGRVVYIGVGLFDTKDAATRLVDELAAGGNSSWILEEVVSRARGAIALAINGNPVAAGEENLELIPATVAELKQVEFAKGYAWHGFADRTYKGPVSIRWGAQDALDAILTSDLEHFLAGVVPSEISSNAAAGAIQAQAVAARGEILSKMGLRHLGEGFDFCAEQHCQVYAGETAASRKLAPVISPTRGLVLRNTEGGIVDAVYSANCGGHSESNHLVWTSPPDAQLAGTWDTGGKPPRLDLTKERDVETFIRNPPKSWCGDASVEGGDKFRWRKKLSRADWTKVEESAGIGRITSITDIARGPSGRIYRITLNGEQGSKTVMKELAIRKLFGGLRSACFVSDWKTDTSGFIIGADIIGSGWGHGVGMCQTGAQAMGKAGVPFQRILEHYFPGGKLEHTY
ncbi:MAG TPA: SpoIID/LytB domain-containing protein [Candidatus Ozemobacteraceae bacterium]|nr:SpoIID/LytB domain-containing protein [Candidatus Ozemobacteraceae bacterium]